MNAQQKALDDIIAAVAKNNGVILSKDDPVMILQTVNSLLIGQVHKAQAEQLKVFEETLQQFLSASSSAHNQHVTQLLNAGLSQASQLLQVRIDTEGAKLLENAETRLDRVAQRMVTAADNTKIYAIINIVACAFVVVACGVVLTF
jgi:hypothetical protein